MFSSRIFAAQLRFTYDSASATDKFPLRILISNFNARLSDQVFPDIHTICSFRQIEHMMLDITSGDWP